MSTDRVRQLLVLASFVFAIFVNAAANIVPLNGQTTAEIADRWRVFVQPAGYVFSIWGLIYLGQLAFVLHTLRLSRSGDTLLRRIGPWPAAVAVLNGAWIFAWHWEVYPATIVVMAGLLASLIVLYRRAGFERSAAPSAFDLRSTNHWFVQVPFSLYLGWITVATIANAAVVGAWAGVPTFGIAPELVAALVLAVGLGIAAAVLVRTGDVVYGAVIVWAYIGIVVKEAQTTAVPVVAGVTVAVVALMMLAALAGRLPLRRLAPG